MSGALTGTVENELQRVADVVRPSASGLTENILVEFDGERLQPQTIREGGGQAMLRASSIRTDEKAPSPCRRCSSVVQTHSGALRARVGVSGLDRDPDGGWG